MLKNAIVGIVLLEVSLGCAAKTRTPEIQEKRSPQQIYADTNAHLYLALPEAANTVVNDLRKLQARVELGINFQNFAELYSDAYGNYRIFQRTDRETLPALDIKLLPIFDIYADAYHKWNTLVNTDNASLKILYELHVREYLTKAAARMPPIERLLENETSCKQELQQYYLEREAMLKQKTSQADKLSSPSAKHSDSQHATR